MLVVSTARIETLLEFSQLEAELTPDDRELQSEDVEIFLDVLFEEATEEGQAAYLKAIEGLEDEMPWAAVRVREWYEPDPGWSELLKAIQTAPPAAALALNRRLDLEPELLLDALPDFDKRDGAYERLYDALFSWDRNHLLRAIGPVGWVLADDTEEIAAATKDAAAKAVEDTAEVAQKAVEKASEAAADVVGDASKIVWAIAKPMLIGVGVIAGTAVVGLVGYAALSRPHVRVVQGGESS